MGTEPIKITAIEGVRTPLTECGALCKLDGGIRERSLRKIDCNGTSYVAKIQENGQAEAKKSV